MRGQTLEQRKKKWEVLWDFGFWRCCGRVLEAGDGEANVAACGRALVGESLVFCFCLCSSSLFFFCFSLHSNVLDLSICRRWQCYGPYRSRSQVGCLVWFCLALFSLSLFYQVSSLHVPALRPGRPDCITSIRTRAESEIVSQ